MTYFKDNYNLKTLFYISFMKIRLAKKEDKKQILSILIEAWWEEISESFNNEFESMFSKFDVKQNFYVAVENSKIIWVWSYSQSFIDYYVYEICWMCVLKEFRNNWVWTKILNKILDKIKTFKWESKAIFAILTAYNTKLYEKFWFKVVRSYIDNEWEKNYFMILDL